METLEDTRIDEIGKIILDHRYKRDPRDMNALKYSSYLIAKKILEYFAPIIEKAEKWDKLTAITADKDCKGCPVTELCKEQLTYCVEECPYRKEWPRTAKDGGSSFFCEKECKQEPPPCNGTGRIKAEWAKEE